MMNSKRGRQDKAAASLYGKPSAVKNTVDSYPTDGSVKMTSTCGASCRHAEELKRLTDKLSTEGTEGTTFQRDREDQHVHHTDAEKCVSKLEAENLRLTSRLKEAENRLRSSPGKKLSDPVTESKESLVVRINHTNQLAQLLPQQCKELKQDCYKLQLWTMDEIRKIKELVHSASQVVLKPNPSNLTSQEKSYTSTSATDSKLTPKKSAQPPPKITESISKPTTPVKKPPESAKIKPAVASKPASRTYSESEKPVADVRLTAKLQGSDFIAAGKSDSVNSAAIQHELPISHCSGNDVEKDLHAADCRTPDFEKDNGVVLTEIDQIFNAISKLNGDVGSDAGSDAQSVDGSISQRTVCSDDGGAAGGGKLSFRGMEGGSSSVVKETKDEISVFCRVRPILKTDKKEDKKAAELRMDPTSQSGGVLHVTYRGRPKTFQADRIINSSATQDNTFDEIKSAVLSSVNGVNATLFAYGHTGSGKTYTMQGTATEPGLVQRTVQGLLYCLESERSQWDYKVTIGVIEMHNDLFRDLLCSDMSSKLDVKQRPDGGISLPTMTHSQVQLITDVENILSLAQTNRSLGIGKTPDHFCRSHLLTIITVTRVNMADNSRTITGKVNMVQLAGSERVEKPTGPGSDPARYKEAQNINKTLTCVGDVLCALRGKSSGHVPFKTSRLTHLLQDSMTGNSRTILLVTLSSSDRHLSETVASLMFAQRVHSVEPPPPLSSRRPSLTPECNFSTEFLGTDGRGAGGGGGGGGGGATPLKLRSVEIDINTSSRRSSVSSERGPMITTTSSSRRRQSGQATPERDSSVTRDRERERTRSGGSTSSGAAPAPLSLARPVKPSPAPGSRTEQTAKKDSHVGVQSATASKTSYPKSPARK